MREDQGFSICFLTNVSHMITSDLRPSTTTKRKRFLENDTVGNVGNQDKDEKGLFQNAKVAKLMGLTFL